MVFNFILIAHKPLARLVILETMLLYFCVHHLKTFRVLIRDQQNIQITRRVLGILSKGLNILGHLNCKNLIKMKKNRKTELQQILCLSKTKNIMNELSCMKLIFISKYMMGSLLSHPYHLKH